MKIDLHVHTTASPDGMNTPRMAVRAAIRKGLSGLAVTDHNTTAAVAVVRAAAPAGFIVIAGAEYSTDCGHVLALFVEEFAARLERNTDGRYKLEELAAFTREHGGLLVAAHPYARRDRLPTALTEYAEGLESVNARQLSRDATSRARVEETAHGLGLFLTGGSDAHIPMEIGRAYTIFPEIRMDRGMCGNPPTREASEMALVMQGLREALVNGACTAEGKPGYFVYRAASRLWKKVRTRG